ncbi:hypothetical protein M5K25_003097 [Dendrobium thyrsiflorum]|uniref:Uncharacterized protein n=1 Tax=Dendrobium thyrsiflorum TaxID=117978 RepID=A0ABD0VPA4_DENTH
MVGIIRKDSGDSHGVHTVRGDERRGRKKRSEMGGGNGQKSKMAREKNVEKMKAANKGFSSNSFSVTLYFADADLPSDPLDLD